MSLEPIILLAMSFACSGLHAKVGYDDRAQERRIYDARVNNMDAAFEAIVEVTLSTTSS